MAIKLYHSQLTITNGSSFLMPGAQSRLVRQTDPPHSLRQFRYATFRLLTFLLAIAGTVSMHAQTSYGSLVGTVADSTGAIVAGAEITVTNVGTNAIQKTTTGGAGNYSFVNLNPGVYSVTAAEVASSRSRATRWTCRSAAPPVSISSCRLGTQRKPSRCRRRRLVCKQTAPHWAASSKDARLKRRRSTDET